MPTITKPSKRFTAVRLDADLRKRVDQKVLDRKYDGERGRFSFEAALHEALEAWVAHQEEQPHQLTS